MFCIPFSSHKDTKKGLKSKSGEEQIDNPHITYWIPRIAHFHFMLTVTVYILGHLIVTCHKVVKCIKYWKILKPDTTSALVFSFLETLRWCYRHASATLVPQ